MYIRDVNKEYEYVNLCYKCKQRMNILIVESGFDRYILFQNDQLQVAVWAH